MGSLRFIFAFATSLVIQAVTVNAVEALGGGAVGWKWIAVIYALIGLAVNTFSVFSVKELPESELEHKKEDNTPAEKIGYIETAKLLFTNKYFTLICGIYLMSHISNAFVGIGIYFMTYVMGYANLLGTFASFTNIPMIIGLLVAPSVIKIWHVQGQPGWLRLRNCLPRSGYRRRLSGQYSHDADLHCSVQHRYEPHAGRPECSDRCLL